MKIFKRLACCMAMGMIVSGTLSCAYASENKGNVISQVIKDYDVGFGVGVKATTPSNYYNPTISDIRTATIDSKLCIVVHVQAYTTISDVQIDGRSATRRTGTTSAGDYYIEANGTKNYSFYVRDINGRTCSMTQYVTISDSTKPSLSLSKVYKNGYCYLEIKASDNTSISSVKVDGSTISFNSSGGTETYKVTQSKTYTVEVKDAAGNITTEKIDIDINDDKPTLTVDKVLKNGTWYLTIKSYPGKGNRISKVTVNNTKISFSSSGETVDYAVSSSGNYKVVVTDNYNQEATQTIYVDCNLKSDSNNPTLTATTKDLGGIMGISISAYPSKNIANNSLKQVTVNGAPVSISAAGGTTDYIVNTSGTYTVVATDINGNSSTQTVSVTVPTQVITTTQNTNVGASKAVFKIKQSSYTLNGVTQPMDGAPALKNGRTMLPVRYVAYALNIEPSKIIWDKTTKTVIIYDGNNVIKAPLNSKTITVNGVDQTMEVPATMINGRVYIPISQIAKAFSGVSINWNDTTKEATIIRQ